VSVRSRRVAVARMWHVARRKPPGRVIASVSGKPRASATILSLLSELALLSVGVRGCMPAVVAIVTQLVTQPAWLADAKLRERIDQRPAGSHALQVCAAASAGDHPGDPTSVVCPRWGCRTRRNVAE
jgi:hypothetical protein